MKINFGDIAATFMLIGAVFGAFFVSAIYSSDFDAEKQNTLDSLRYELAECRSKSKVGREAFRQKQKWLARAVYSETKRPREMRLVANVIRNRVDSCWRGKCSYKAVVLDENQFSAFNTETPTRYDSLAYKVAEDVLLMKEDNLPLSTKTLHFYSPRSIDGAPPKWHYAMEEIRTPVPSHRFRFFETDVSSNALAYGR